MNRHRRIVFWSISIPILSILVLATVCAAIYWLVRLFQPPAAAGANGDFAFKVFAEKSDNTCYAVVYRESEDKLIFMSAAHYFKRNPPPYHIELAAREIEDVQIPDEKRDVAFFSIDKAGIVRGKDFGLPVFVSKVKITDPITIFHDDLYQISDRKVEQINTAERSILLSGIVAKGRSGSPAFIKGTDQCIGVVSGYYEKSKMTLVLSP